MHLGKFYPPHNGGIETHVRDLAVREAAHASVSVVASSSSRRQERHFLEGVDVTRVGRWCTIASMPVCPGLTAAIRRSPADLVHLHVPNPGAAFSFLRSGHTGRLVITHHADTLGRKLLRRISDPFVRAAMNRAAAIIVTSRRYLDSSAELAPYREKCRVIPLGIDMAAITHSLAEPQPGFDHLPDGPVILAVGRLVPYKGFDVLVRAMRDVRAELILIGEGPEGAKLQSLINSLGLQKKVRMIGRVNDLAAYFHAASIFVMPSVTRAEAFGMVQLEAMVTGLPVVNTDLDSGVPEVSVHQKTGLTVAPGDVHALADAIQLLLSRQDLREQYGSAARERVLAEFTVERMVERTLALYDEVLRA